jgi:hypothetical protein
MNALLHVTGVRCCLHDKDVNSVLTQIQLCAQQGQPGLSFLL